MFYNMKQFSFLAFLAFLLFATESFGQLIPATAGGTGLTTAYREGLTGIGFQPPISNVDNAANVFAPNQGAKFIVKNGLLAHYDAGQVGLFASGNTWSGLGFSGPAAPTSAYGLAIARSGNVGFFNLLPNGAGQDLVAAIGSTGTNVNAFRLRNYDNVSSATPTIKDLLVAKPTGSVGINADPLSTLWVDASQDVGATFKNIAIKDGQRFGIPSAGTTQIFASTGIGAQANSSLASSGIAAEGIRAQFPEFGVAATSGVATNLQVVKSPYGGNGNPAIDAIAAPAVSNGEYAELSWQDLDNTSTTLSATDCTAFPIAAAEAANKFFISFRNNVATNPFNNNNRLPVMTFQANGRVGIGTLQPVSSAGGCVGGVYNRPILLDINGFMTSQGSLISSDRRFKKDIQPIGKAMELVRQLQGTTYNFRQSEFPTRNFPTGNQFGFIAQDVEKVLPEIAAENSDGFYTVNYTMLIPILTEAVKEQDKTITDLRTEMAELRSVVNDLKANQQPADLTGYRLDQNTPNPANGVATIRYAMPKNTVGARITVYDLTGRTLKSFVLSATEGEITLNASELGSGLYLYDLQVGGRQILERKMTVAAGN
jgi:Chaperone of endosialidase/Secretion system C-terminal sorting domain